MANKIIPTPEEFENRAEVYFAMCETEQRPLSFIGLALGVGLCNRSSLHEYLGYEEFTDVVKKAKARVEQWTVERALKSNGSGAIFLLKNMDYSDKLHLQTDPIQLTISGKDSQL